MSIVECPYGGTGPYNEGAKCFYVVSRVMTRRITELWADDEDGALRKFASGVNGKPVEPESTTIQIECIEMVESKAE